MPKGLLRTQDPKPNQYIRRGGVVTSSLSKGNPRVKVPSVTGKSFPQAQIALEGSRLKVGRQALLHSNEPKDAVIAQVPAPGETVDSFTEVNLLVSAGPREPEYAMPHLRNQPLERAFKAMRPAGITIERIKSEVRDDLESGTILAQSPPPGTKIRKKDAVSFTVSSRSSEQGQGSRYVKVAFQMPEGNPRRLQIDVFDASGTRTIYNRMESPLEPVEVGVSVSGKASAQIYLNQEFVKEIPIE
jgi:serine/threonine-protein kinase